MMRKCEVYLDVGSNFSLTNIWWQNDFVELEIQQSQSF
jgi:hypothetical protein